MKYPADLPKRITIIRHAEKEKHGPDLSPKGFARAAALGVAIPNWGKVDAIFAAQSSFDSSRPYETVDPLCLALSFEADVIFKDNEYEKVAKLLLSGEYAEEYILICWHHENIPNLVQCLGVTNAPDLWASDEYARKWIVEYDSEGEAQFQDLPQELMWGDNEYGEFAEFRRRSKIREPRMPSDADLDRILSITNKISDI